MTVAQATERLKQRWSQYFETARKPAACLFCKGTTLWWNGQRVRSASVLCEGVVVHLPEVPCRRVKCGDRLCHRSWTLRPEGLSPQRHYQLDVVAEGTSHYLFAAEATLSGVAEQLDCSRRTVRRWIGWVGAIATVSALLWHLLELAGQPVAPRVPQVLQPKRKARSAVGQAGLQAAAGVLCVLEALATAAGLPAAGLSSVVQAVVAERYRVTSYAEPVIPEFARGERLWFLPRSRCEL